LAGTDLVTRKAGNAVSSIDPSNSPPRSRRRLAAWLAFGAVGLATGAVWATGFASAGGSSSGRVTSPALARTAPVDQVDRLAGTVVVDTPLLDYTYEGSWGAIVDTNLFTVDLTGHAGTYNLALLLADTTPLTGWSSLQIEFQMVPASGGGGTTCVASDYAVGTAAADKNVMRFDAADAAVYWNAVPGNAVYCLGVDASDGRSLTRTWLHGANEAVSPSVFPAFVATVDRAS
jgi:hypothetical protein